MISRPAEPGFITDADSFEVYDGGTFERLGGFQAVGTGGICLTANPANILLGTLTGPSILNLDLDPGNVAKVVWDVQTGVADVRLPDPRQDAPRPLRWSFFTDINSNGHALLVDFDNATGVDLADTLVRPCESAAYPTLRFAPDGTLATARVTSSGYYLLDPEMAADARLLNGGMDDMVNGAPEFSPGSSRLAYVMRPPNDDPREGRLVVQDLDSGDVVEIGQLGANGVAVFSPHNDDDLIVFDGGAVTRRESRQTRAHRAYPLDDASSLLVSRSSTFPTVCVPSVSPPITRSS